MHTDQIRIERVYRDALRARQLDTVAGVLARVEGRVVAWSRTTDTLYVPGVERDTGFYVKRYYYPRWKHRWRGALRGTFFGRHRGQAEHALLDEMRTLGLPAVRPVAYGARRVGHFVAACFVITEETPQSLNLTTLATGLNEGRWTPSPAQRREMVRKLARQIADLHAADFSHGQLFWRNILVRTEPVGDPEFFFLDVRPGRGRRRLGRKVSWWIDELAHLTASSLPFTTRTERMRFLVTYFGARRLPAPVKEQIRQIERLAQRWRRHEARRIRMNELFEAWNRQLARDTTPALGAPA